MILVIIPIPFIQKVNLMVYHKNFTHIDSEKQLDGMMLMIVFKIVSKISLVHTGYIDLSENYM